ncbi:MAG: serine hydrolase [Myxococcales bacterium]|nr:serine hydrolase [Myxococcales bacterium]
MKIVPWYSALCLIVLANLIACTNGEVPQPPPEVIAPEPKPSSSSQPSARSSSQPSSQPSSQSSSAPTSDKIPLARIKLSWLIGLLNLQDGVLSEAEVKEHFSEAFLKQISTEKLISMLQSLAKELKPFHLVSINPENEGDHHIQALLRTSQGQAQVLIRLQTKSPHRIEGLRVQPVSPTATKISSFEDAAKALDTMGETPVLYVAEVSDKTCTPIFTHDASQAVAIGSTFKLYVLASLLDQIAARVIRWDQNLEVMDEHKSLPPGTFQDLPHGSKVSVLKATKAMISMSDNTAADMLIRQLGRDMIEQKARTLGNTRNQPLLTTRELFLLKLVSENEEVKRYLKMSDSQQRAYLNEQLGKTQLPSVKDLKLSSSWTTPKYIDSIEWFATASDLCRVWVDLLTKADNSSVTREIVSTNPGITVDPKIWSFVGYKGGSEPGALSLSWWLKRNDGRVFVVIVAIQDSRRSLITSPIVGVATQVLGLVAQQ